MYRKRQLVQQSAILLRGYYGSALIPGSVAKLEHFAGVRSSWTQLTYCSIADKLFLRCNACVCRFGCLCTTHPLFNLDLRELESLQVGIYGVFVLILQHIVGKDLVETLVP